MKLSDFNFVKVDGQQIQKDIINFFESYTGETLSVGDARRQFLQGVAYVIAIVMSSINITGKENLLQYSYGKRLDELGQLLGVTRLEAEASKVTLQFTLSNAQPTEIEIPQGTRATADGNIFFTTDEALIIPSGSIKGEVTATATVTGEIGNGYIEGQISKIVDGVPYVGAVINTTTSTDGRDEETDEDLKERIRIAPFSFSTAGAKEAYNYLALTANPNVGDVETFRTDAGSVTVAIVKKDGTLPETDDEVLTDVANAVNDKTARPLTDNVTVTAATPVNDTINVTFYVGKEDSAVASEIQADVTNAVNEFALWQTTKIGRDINPDRLRKLMYNAGAYVVEITTPTAQAVNNGEVAQFTDIKVNYGGIKD